jgi:hypothetical protein
MINKFISALVAGIIFGILIGITAAIPCLIIISFVLMVILGAITVHLARENILNATDALTASGLAGCISGVVGAIVATIGLTIVVYVLKYHNSEVFSGHDLGGLGIYGLICAPVLIVSGVLLSAIGGYVYYEMVAKRSA